MQTTYLCVCECMYAYVCVTEWLQLKIRPNLNIQKNIY